MWPDIDLPPINLWNLPNLGQNKMKILIAGYGFVGKAHALTLEGKGVTTHVYDPAKGYDVFPRDIDAAIICVSTPQANDGRCDMSNVYDVVSKIPNDIPILIKSTISIDGWRLLQRQDPRANNISFSPEFLRADHALEDFKNQKVIYIGGGQLHFWVNLLSNRLNTTIELCEPEELILAKYFRNSFLATKVAFFNQIYDLCEKLNIEYSAVAHYVTEDPRIGDSHSFITEERGFGGHCFPKDTSAIVSDAIGYDVDLSIINEAIKYNEKIRGK